MEVREQTKSLIKQLKAKCNSIFFTTWVLYRNCNLTCCSEGFWLNSLLSSYRIIGCSNKISLPSNNHVLCLDSNTVKPQSDARVWAWLRSLCHLDRTRKKFKSKVGPDHLALDPVLKGRIHLLVRISSVGFLLLSLLSFPIGPWFGLLQTK